MKLVKVKSAISSILESKDNTIADPVEPIETGVDVVDAETAEEDTEKINKEVNKRVKDAEKNALAVKGEDHAEQPKLVKESKEFKKEERKELGAFIHELKENKIKHRVSRSTNEGYRYLVEYLTEAKLDEVDLNGDTTHTVEVPQSEFKPEVKEPKDDDKEIIISKEGSDEEEVVSEGAQGKKEPGIEFVVFDASTEGKAPILGIRSTRVEAEWLMNRLMKTGKYENVSFDEAPKGRFHKGDDFWGPFDANWEKIESVEEKHVCTKCGKEPCECKEEVVKEAIDTSKEVWEGWTVQDFIDELEPSFEMIMRGESWIKPFANKEELKKWCMSEQPYYKKYIPEVVSYFDGRVKEMGGYGKKGNSGLFDEGVISGASKLSYDELAELEKSLWEKLNAQGIYPEDGTFSNSSNSLADLDLEILIDGDWKHDHLLAEHLVEEWCQENGYVISRHTDEVTNDTGRDDYEALHKWILLKETDGSVADTVAGLQKMFKRPEDESLKEKVNKNKRPLYRVVLVQWRDAYNSDTDYLEDFNSKEEAIKYVEDHRKELLDNEKEFLDDLVALDVDVEEWDENDDISVVHSIQLWEKKPEKESIGEGLEPRLEVEYWYDEEARDQGLGDIYFGDIDDEEAGIDLVRKMIDREGFASAELLLDGEVIYGYDGESEWGPRAKKSESITEDKERLVLVKTVNSCVDAVDLADALEAQGIYYEFGDNGVLVKKADFDRADAILMDLEAECNEEEFESLKEDKEEKEEPESDPEEDSEEDSEESSEESDEVEIKAVTDVNSEEVTTTVDEIKDIALEATKAAMAKEEAEEKILPEEEVKEITDEVVNDQLGIEDEDDVSWVTSNDMSALNGEPSEEEPSENSEEEIAELEDEDDVSWLK